jgi:hypothetical protein
VLGVAVIRAFFACFAQKFARNGHIAHGFGMCVFIYH